MFLISTEDRSSDGDDLGFERISNWLLRGEGWLPGIGLSLGGSPVPWSTGMPSSGAQRSSRCPAVCGQGNPPGRKPRLSWAGYQPRVILMCLRFTAPDARALFSGGWPV